MRLSLKRLAVVLVVTAGAVNLAVAQNAKKDSPALQGRIVAVGIPGASAISPVGTFLPGGPIHDKPALHAFTQPGRVLDPVRILVGSNSNFGAPLARTDEREGSFLSIDPTGSDTLVIDPNFATSGGQASTLGGAVQVYTSNNAAFLNSITNPLAATGNFTGASNPLGISINNAFGRLWPANAPTRLEGAGTSTILDPQGFGLAGAPNPNFGGVYFADLANRGVVGVPGVTSQVIAGGLNSAAVGTALLGPSPDGSTRAVFFVVEADGSIVQEHTRQGLDGVVGPGTIAPLIGQRDKIDGDGNPGVTPRLGVVLKWEPNLVLFVSEPFQNTIAALNITPDPPSPSAVLRVTGIQRFSSDALNQPVDLAPVTMETTDHGFASNSTLDSNSDFYVANRGDNTIVRMTQTGQVVSVRQVTRADGMPFGDARLNGITTSPDGTTIWVTITGHMPGIPNSTGAVLQLSAF
ncbi:MAG TPA: hypothetical protein VKW06_09835 [Candidatus Angelobacter sp.]|nr:hypothetical protein [Candidatus Angelobacter sp.]